MWVMSICPIDSRRLGREKKEIPITKAFIVNCGKKKRLARLSICYLINFFTAAPFCEMDPRASCDFHFELEKTGLHRKSYRG